MGIFHVNLDNLWWSSMIEQDVSAGFVHRIIVTTATWNACSSQTCYSKDEGRLIEVFTTEAPIFHGGSFIAHLKTEENLKIFSSCSKRLCRCLAHYKG